MQMVSLEINYSFFFILLNILKWNLSVQINLGTFSHTITFLP